MQTITDKDFIDFIGKQESQYIMPASHWADDVIAEFNGNNVAQGDLLPWSKTHNLIVLRPGEVSLWGGFNGHGKSQILGQAAAWNLKEKPWLLASMEMPPRKTMRRMIRQVAGSSRPTDEYITRFSKWTDGRLWMYDQVDTVEHEKILGMVHYASEVLGIKHIVIDSLMKCGFRGSKDQISSKQVDFVDRLCWAAKHYNNHIHLVHHMRKGEGNQSEYNRPGKHDFRGAGEIADLVDNQFIIHRNKRKEVMVGKGEEVDDSIPDATLECTKQRHGEWEGLLKFWFHEESQQYTPDANNRPLPYGI